MIHVGNDQDTARDQDVRRIARPVLPAICAEGIRLAQQFLARKLRALIRISRLPLRSLLMAGEHAIPAAKYAVLTGNLLRPSTPIGRSPHVALLQEFQDVGDELFRPVLFEKTQYYRNAIECIELVGQYFGITRHEDVLQFAEEFVGRFRCDDRVPPRGVLRQHQTRHGKPVLVRPIRYSDCYEIVDGQHRCAIAFARGHQEIDAVVRGKPVLTPLQQRLLDVMWTNGERILYQPIDSPEVTGYWTPIRRCTDRLEMMTRFLCTAGVNVGNSTFLDIASSYGWFLSEMRKLGSEVHGIERDPVAISVGELVYGVPRDHVTRGDCVRVLRACDRRFDVVACFSILHHFALGKGSVPPEDFIRLVDQATRTVLFLDTGQCAEAWFKKSLAAWNPDFIEKWLLRNTTFTRVLRLGTDCDNIGRYKNNYGRTLFACTRAS